MSCATARAEHVEEQSPSTKHTSSGLVTGRNSEVCLNLRSHVFRPLSSYASPSNAPETSHLLPQGFPCKGISENKDACLLALTLLTGLVNKIALLESTHMTPVSSTTCPGFQFSMHQLPKQILGTSQTCLSYPLTNIRCLSDPFIAERPHHVRYRPPLHPPHLQCHIHLPPFPCMSLILSVAAQAALSANNC